MMLAMIQMNGLNTWWIIIEIRLLLWYNNNIVQVDKKLRHWVFLEHRNSIGKHKLIRIV
jgi:hypothetical protein